MKVMVKTEYTKEEKAKFKGCNFKDYKTKIEDELTEVLQTYVLDNYSTLIKNKDGMFMTTTYKKEDYIPEVPKFELEEGETKEFKVNDDEGYKRLLADISKVVNKLKGTDV